VHHIGLFIKGGGILAGMLKIMFNGLNATHTINSYTSSEGYVLFNNNILRASHEQNINNRILTRDSNTGIPKTGIPVIPPVSSIPKYQY